MSSGHIVIIARNSKTGEVQLPLEDLTLYGCGGEESVLDTCRLNYSEDWSLALYRPMSGWVCGAQKSKKAAE